MLNSSRNFPRLFNRCIKEGGSLHSCLAGNSSWMAVREVPKLVPELVFTLCRHGNNSRGSPKQCPPSLTLLTLAQVGAGAAQFQRRKWKFLMIRLGMCIVLYEVTTSPFHHSLTYRNVNRRNRRRPQIPDAERK